MKILYTSLIIYVYGYYETKACGDPSQRSSNSKCNYNCHLAENGTCVVCPKGRFGFDCSRLCPVGFFGHLCNARCSCYDNQTCDLLNGCTDMNEFDLQVLSRCPDSIIPKWLIVVSASGWIVFILSWSPLCLRRSWRRIKRGIPADSVYLEVTDSPHVTKNEEKNAKIRPLEVVHTKENQTGEAYIDVIHEDGDSYLEPIRTDRESTNSYVEIKYPEDDTKTHKPKVTAYEMPIVTGSDNKNVYKQLDLTTKLVVRSESHLIDIGSKVSRGHDGAEISPAITGIEIPSGETGIEIPPSSCMPERDQMPRPSQIEGERSSYIDMTSPVPSGCEKSTDT